MKPREILAKAQASPHNLHFGEFVRLVEAYGFVLKRTRGSHRLYSREQVPLVNLQEARGRAKAYQVREFLALIESYNLTLKDEE